MGYYVELISANWQVPENDSVFKALTALNADEELKYGGSYGPEGKTESWFSWMSPNYDTECFSVTEILEQLGFDIEVNEEISVEHPYPMITICGYSSKTGQEDIFIEAMTPFVADGSFIEWRGEEGETWLLRAVGGKLYRSEGEVVYENFKEINPAKDHKLIMNAIKTATAK